MLKYSLSENLLTECPDDYSAQTNATGSLDKEALVARMLSKGTLVTRTDILAVLNNLEETVVQALLEGYTVTSPLFNTSFSISGVFDSPKDTFDGNRHKLNINVTKGTLLRNAEKNVKFEKTNAVAPLPQIHEVKDVLSSTVNERLTSKGVIEISGYNIKIDGEQPPCGVWFVHENGTETPAEIYIENKPSKILAMIPQLATGNYQIKIVTQYSGSNLLKTPKTYIYPKMLVVEM